MLVGEKRGKRKRKKGKENRRQDNGINPSRVCRFDVESAKKVSHSEGLAAAK